MMTKSENFDSNLKLFSRFFPQTALIDEVDITSFELTKTHLGEDNLVKHTSCSDIYYHSMLGALNEAEATLSHIDLARTQSIVYFGLGLGYSFDVLKSWLALSSLHSLVIVEDDLAVIRCFLNSSKAKTLLTHPQVSIVYLSPNWKEFAICAESLEQAESFFINLEKNWKYALLPMYGHLRKDDAQLLYRRLIQYIYYLMSSTQIGGISFEEDLNFYWNLLEFLEAFSTQNLKEIAETLPFVICGAGPSLKNQFGILKELRNEMILSAAGTGMNVLNSSGIEADLGFGIDASLGEANRIKAQSGFMTPFFISLQFAREGSKHLHGPKFIALNRQDLKWRKDLIKTLPLEKEMQLNLSWTSTLFAALIGCELARENIIFLGVDLAYLEGKRYGLQENWIGVEKATLNGIYIQKENQDQILSSYEFMMESKFLAKLVHENPTIHFLYASPLGQGIEGTFTVDFKEWSNEIQLSQFDVSNEIHAAIFRSPKLQISPQDLIKILKPWNEKLRQLDSALKLHLEELTAFQQNPSNKYPQWVNQISETQAFFNHYSDLTDRHFDSQKRFFQIMREFWDETTVLRKLSYIEQKKFLFIQSLVVKHLQTLSEILLQLQNYPAQKVVAETQISKNHKAEKESPPYTGEWLRKFPSGKKKALQTYHEGKLHGSSQFYAENGNVLAESHFEQGKRIGEMKQYYQSGKIYSLQYWKQGQKVGVHQFFFENGDIKAILPYEKGILDGYCQLFNPNNELKYESEFHQGVRDGLFRSLTNGVLTEEGQYAKGILLGKYCRYYPSGKLHLERHYYADGTYDEKEWSKEQKLISEHTSHAIDEENELTLLKISIESLLKDL